MSPIPSSSGNTRQLKDIRDGAILQCLEAMTLGMPLEVWKTRMGSNLNEGPFTAFRNIYLSGGGGFRGVRSFWNGLAPKLVESASKGAVLLWAKEFTITEMNRLDFDPRTSGLAGGVVGGVAQTVVMAPMTFIITGLVVSRSASGQKPISSIVGEAWRAKGLAGIYSGWQGVLGRQCSNWALRQFLTESVRAALITRMHPGETIKTAKLSPLEEVFCGAIGGGLAVVNQPFEVIRLRQQTATVRGEKSVSVGTIVRTVYRDHGIFGLYTGWLPRMGLSIWQTVFMVSLAKVARQYFP